MKVARDLAFIAAVGALMHAAGSVSTSANLRLRGAALILSVGFALVAALFAGKLFNTFGLPKLTGYLATGMIAGPAMLGFLDEGVIADLRPINGVATALIALTAGSEMDLRSMRPLFRSIGWITAIAVCGTAVLLGVALYFLQEHLPFIASAGPMGSIAISMTLGVVVVAQSPAVVVAIRAETGADGPVVRTALGVVVLADLLVIVLFAVMSSMTTALLEGSLDVGRQAREAAWHLGGSIGIGIVIGMILAVYVRLISRNIDLFVLAVCLVAAEVGRRVSLDPLLLMLAAGMFVENAIHAGKQLMHAFESASLPVYVLFFTVAGASIHLELLPMVALPVAVLVTVRGVGLYTGARIAARIAGAGEDVRRWAGFGLLPQAGLAIALALLFSRTFPSFGDEARVLTLAIVSVNELLAPLLFRLALVRSGEAQGELRSTEMTLSSIEIEIE